MEPHNQLFNIQRLFALAVVVVAGLWAGCGPAKSHGPGTEPDASNPWIGASETAGQSTDPFTDDDGGGYTEIQGDCNDNDPAVHPFADEVCDDGKDNDCNGYVDILAPLGASVQLDGAAPATLSTTTIGGSNHTVTSIALADGVHIILSNDPIGVMVYGYGGPGNIHPSTQNVSYRFPGGLDPEAINPVE